MLTLEGNPSGHQALECLEVLLKTAFSGTCIMEVAMFEKVLESLNALGRFEDASWSLQLVKVSRCSLVCVGGQSGASHKLLEHI